MVLADIITAAGQFGMMRLLTEVCAHGGRLKLRETARQRLDQMWSGKTAPERKERMDFRELVYITVVADCKA